MRLVLKPDLRRWTILLNTVKYISGSASSLFSSRQHQHRNSNRRNCRPPVWPKCPQRPLLVPSYVGATKGKIKFTQKVFVDSRNRCFWPCPRFVCCVALITKRSEKSTAVRSPGWSLRTSQLPTVLRVVPSLSRTAILQHHIWSSRKLSGPPVVHLPNVSARVVLRAPLGHIFR